MIYRGEYSRMYERQPVRFIYYMKGRRVAYFTQGGRAAIDSGGVSPGTLHQDAVRGWSLVQ